MRKLLLLLAVAVAFSLPGFAQAAGSTQTETTKSTSTSKTTKTKDAAGQTSGAAKESQLTGCLGKNAEGNGFTLTNGRHTKGVEVKSTEDLSGHVGHKVKLMGSWEKPAAGQTMRTFNATSMKHIADTCSATEGGGKKGGKKTAAEKPTGF